MNPFWIGFLCGVLCLACISLGFIGLVALGAWLEGGRSPSLPIAPAFPHRYRRERR